MALSSEAINSTTWRSATTPEESPSTANVVLTPETLRDFTEQYSNPLNSVLDAHQRYVVVPPGFQESGLWETTIDSRPTSSRNSQSLKDSSRDLELYDWNKEDGKWYPSATPTKLASSTSSTEKSSPESETKQDSIPQGRQSNYTRRQFSQDIRTRLRASQGSLP